MSAFRPMKLYYTPTSCGAVSFMTAYICGIPNVECEEVDLITKKTASGGDFLAINPKGNVPCLILDDGTMFNEGAATLQYLADKSPGTLLPAYGTADRYHAMGLINYVASEIHASYGAIIVGKYGAGHSAELLAPGYSLLKMKFVYLNKFLAEKKYALGNALTVVDLYLYVCLSWSPFVEFSLDDYPNIKSYFTFIGGLESVKACHARMATKPSTII